MSHKRSLIKTIKSGRGKRCVMECFVCKKHFEIYGYLYDMGQGFFCSRKCSRKGLPQPRYKGRIKRDGYWYIHAPAHPSCKGRKQPYIAEHRLVMERKLRRYLLKEEVVHHIDHDRTNNREDNLKLFKSAGEHAIREHVESIYGKFVQMEEL
jgi:hypothetical protein